MSYYYKRWFLKKRLPILETRLPSAVSTGSPQINQPQIKKSELEELNTSTEENNKSDPGKEEEIYKLCEMEEFLGKKYTLVNSENFVQLLVFLGIRYMQRQIAMTLKPVQYVERNENGTYTLHFQCLMATSEVVFTPGVDFIETKPDGTKVKAFITFEGNKIKHRQVEDNGRTLNHVYEFFTDKLVITTTGVGLEVVVKRYFSPVDL